MRSALSRTALVLAVAALLAPAAGGSSGVVRWRGLSDGEAEARKSGKPLLYYFTAGCVHHLSHASASEER